MLGPAMRNLRTPSRALVNQALVAPKEVWQPARLDGSRQEGPAHFDVAAPVTSTWILRFTSSSAALRYFSNPQSFP